MLTVTGSQVSLHVAEVAGNDLDPPSSFPKIGTEASLELVAPRQRTHTTHAGQVFRAGSVLGTLVKASFC